MPGAIVGFRVPWTTCCATGARLNFGGALWRFAGAVVASERGALSRVQILEEAGYCEDGAVLVTQPRRLVRLGVACYEGTGLWKVGWERINAKDPARGQVQDKLHFQRRSAELRVALLR